MQIEKCKSTVGCGKGFSGKVALKGQDMTAQGRSPGNVSEIPFKL